MTSKKSREIHLKKRPVGLPNDDDFELVEVDIPELNQNELMVQNIYMSVDPYMRGRMIERESYVPGFQLNEVLEGHCIGRVTASKNEGFGVGDHVMSLKGWREYYISDGEGLMKVDPAVAPIQTFLGVLGITGFTAWVGLLDYGQPKENQTVFVSAASGAVGSMVCQIAKLKGCRVIGSAGADKKVAWLLEEAGIDAGFNYKTVDSIVDEVGRLCPEGLDIYFENVGGEHLEAALEHINTFGRIVLCGMMTKVNETEPLPGPRNLDHAHRKRLTLKGFNVVDHLHRLPEFHTDMGKWIADGHIKWQETIAEGIENAPQAFIGLFKGENFGKMIVKIGDV